MDAIDFIPALKYKNISKKSLNKKFTSFLEKGDNIMHGTMCLCYQIHTHTHTKTVLIFIIIEFFCVYVIPEKRGI